MIIKYSLISKAGTGLEYTTDRMFVCSNADTIWDQEVGVLTGELSHASFFASVCDGIDHAELGKECSSSVNDEYCVLKEGNEDIARFDVSDAVRFAGEGLKRVHELLLQLTETRDDSAQMNACNGLCFVTKNNIVYGNVGNTRFYRFRDSVLELLTEDDTEAWDMVKEGKTTPDNIHTFPGYKKLTHTIGGKGKSKPILDIQRQRLEAGDVFLLCSDGLTDGILDREIEQCLVEALNSEGELPVSSIEGIFDKAREKNSTDNASAILFQVFPKFSQWTEMIRGL